ncbi:GNAT family N-acetyltransferase [Tabrizicola sp. J26]|uniref:GNAT family N-acetyltransferase n=1 Tax=Alitabrizicola rongguiensis TaxID=2909234 RepID=UPI001F3F7050|nr:GNAT family N-acetyltransferase [Tabrizicola rongguiensis]MCF1710074.1 GNAT family N-acetyltransferase [Tabrizicola rongguiensis]
MIRPLCSADEPQWRELWKGYLTFYETALPDEVTDATFARLQSDDPDEMRGRVAEVSGRLVGMVHYVRHRHCWRDEKVTYLQDLFALPETRGTGLGRALIEAVYREADLSGSPMVYWLTARSNATARQLYDRIGVLTPFIEYDRPE